MVKRYSFCTEGCTETKLDCTCPSFEKASKETIEDMESGNAKKQVIQILSALMPEYKRRFNI